MLEEILEAIREKVLQWYERGIKRDMRGATDLIVENQIYKEADIVHAPNSMKVKSKIKMSKSILSQ